MCVGRVFSGSAVLVRMFEAREAAGHLLLRQRSLVGRRRAVFAAVYDALGLRRWQMVVVRAGKRV